MTATDDEVVDKVGHVTVLIYVVGIYYTNAIHIEVVGVEIRLQGRRSKGKYTLGTLCQRCAGCGASALLCANLTRRQELAIDLDGGHVGGVEGKGHRVIGIDFGILDAATAHRNLLCLKREGCAYAYQKSK